MGRYYLRSARTAVWVVTALLAVMAGSYQVSPPPGVPLAYHRLQQFLWLATVVAAALPFVQAVRIGRTPLQGRLRLPPGPAAYDGWAYQLWGPLLLENLCYGGWLWLCLAFAGLQTGLLPAPEPWQAIHPPFAAPGPDRLWMVVKLYLSAFPVTVAAAYLKVLSSEAKPRFSLLELVIVSSALLVLGAILAPNFVRARARGRLTACKSNLKNIGTALEMYSTDNLGRYPPSPNELLPNYLKTIPTCPTVGWVTYQFQMASNPDLYTVVCAGHNHEGSGVAAPNYPQYTSITGLIERP